MCSAMYITCIYTAYDVYLSKGLFEAGFVVFCHIRDDI